MLTFGRRYRVRGLEKTSRLEVLKVNLLARAVMRCTPVVRRFIWIRWTCTRPERCDVREGGFRRAWRG